MDKLNIRAEDILFVSDNLIWDIMGPQDAGMTGVWFNPSRENNKTDIQPECEIDSLESILELIN